MRQKNIKINGVDTDIFYPENFDKKVFVVLVHGFLSNKNSTKADILCEESIKKGFGFVKFSFRGNGESELNFSEMSLKTNIEDIKNILNYLLEAEKAKNFYLIGSSFGCSSIIGCLYENKNFYNYINKIILLAPALNLKERFPEKFSEEELVKYKKEGFLEIMHYKDDKKVKLSYNLFLDLFNYDLENEIKNIEKNILIIHGTEDESIPITLSRKYFKENRNIKLIEVEGDGHRLHNGVKNNLEEIFKCTK